jgi:hypothetical protein
MYRLNVKPPLIYYVQSIPKLNILIDSGDHSQETTVELEKIYPQLMTKIQFEISPKPSKQEGKLGFVHVATRWVIERSNAWVERCRSLVKNFEGTLDNAKAKFNFYFISIILKRPTSS